jgi:hypothetical protein
LKPNLEKRSLYSFTVEELRDYFKENGLSKFVADQIYDWVYKKFVFAPENWSNISNKVKTHSKSENSIFVDCTLSPSIFRKLREKQFGYFYAVFLQVRFVTCMSILTTSRIMRLSLTIQVSSSRL